jgi:hypothetical protein
VEHGTHLTLVDRNDAMASEVVQVLQNPTSAQAMAQRGRCLVEHHYDWEILANRLEMAWLSTARPEAAPRTQPNPEFAEAVPA